MSDPDAPAGRRNWRRKVLLACAKRQACEAPSLALGGGCSACVWAAAAGLPDEPRLGDVIEDQAGRQAPHRQLFHAGSGKGWWRDRLRRAGVVLAVVAQAKDFAAAFSAAYSAAREVRFSTGCFYRRDIGHQVAALLGSGLKRRLGWAGRNFHGAGPQSSPTLAAPPAPG